MIGEFELIQRFFDRSGLNDQSDVLALGIGDDCAIMDVPADHQLCFSMDTLVAGVHFPADADPEQIARRSLAVNLSDLAAMGATPACFTLALCLPQADSAWLERFSQGLEQVAKVYGVSLAGGDTTRGPLSITIQVQGLLPTGKALRRDAASVDDLVLVSGTLGDAAGALAMIDREASLLNEAQQQLRQRYYSPPPRVELGQHLLAAGCRCAIDVSDGLLADLGHILSRSGVGAVLDPDRLPLSAALLAEQPDRARQHALAGGDDYELCFTLPEPLWNALQTELCALVPCTPIGRIQASPELVTVTGEPLLTAGYRHF